MKFIVSTSINSLRAVKKCIFKPPDALKHKYLYKLKSIVFLSAFASRLNISNASSCAAFKNFTTSQIQAEFIKQPSRSQIIYLGFISCFSLIISPLLIGFACVYFLLLHHSDILQACYLFLSKS